MNHLAIKFRKAICLSTFFLLSTFLDTGFADEITIVSSKDNTMFENNAGALSNGAGSYLFSGQTGFGGGFMLRRGLIYFDIAGQLPAGAVISSVELTMDLTQSQSSNTATVSLHRTARNWGEGASNSDGTMGGGQGAPSEPDDATWLHTFYSTPTWANAGGDFDANASASVAVGPTLTTYAWSSPQLLADVRNWANDATTNFGWAVIGDEATAGSAKRFDSRENTNGNGPKLRIIFTVPVDVTPDSWALSAGTYVSGSEVELSESDNMDLTLRRDILEITSRTEFTVKGVSPEASPSSMQFTLEGSVFARTLVTQRIELFDYDLDVWEEVDSRAANRFSDATVNVNLSGDLSRFIEPGTHCMEARLNYRSSNQRQQFSSSTDRTIWTITP